MDHTDDLMRYGRPRRLSAMEDGQEKAFAKRIRPRQKLANESLVNDNHLWAGEVVALIEEPTA
jgi:hypothetical protein